MIAVWWMIAACLIGGCAGVLAMMLMQTSGSLREQSTPAPISIACLDSMDGAPKSRHQPSRTFLARSLIDIGALDARIQEQIAKYGNLKDFMIAVWRQELDAINCNW